jgi:hypothetical protein
MAELRDHAGGDREKMGFIWRKWVQLTNDLIIFINAKALKKRIVQSKGISINEKKIILYWRIY